MPSARCSSVESPAIGCTSDDSGARAAACKAIQDLQPLHGTLSIALKLNRRVHEPVTRFVVQCTARTCSTVLRALREVAAMVAAKPSMLNEGSAPVATTRPAMTGMRERYTPHVSRWLIITRARTATNAGVVAPMACRHAKRLFQGFRVVELVARGIFRVHRLCTDGLRTQPCTRL